MSDAAEPEAVCGVRFVVLRHTNRRGVHFDLLIEDGDHLATWRCPQSPESSGAKGLVCDKLGDHRKRYLDYEGPISRDRGEVMRHDEGSCEVRRSGEEHWEVVFHGRHLKGPHGLERLDRRPPPDGELRGSSGAEAKPKEQALGGHGSSWLFRAQ
jgi:hypothetical protein